ncbi:MAG: ImmA/IrrE family metallo-endopeptidase [Fimbriimonadaceae bacterium]|nr:ImmA/IrrE family metallo-endopeptidase [Fimbriimonadaceae bacterium]
MDEADVQQRARSFIAPLDLRNIRDDLSVYLNAANAILRKEEMEVGESGTTLTRPDGKHIITVNSCEPSERQRYTICHESAHVILGLSSSHDGVPSWSYVKRHPNEIACDWFAAELLMPYKQWLAAVPKEEPSVAVIKFMASEFGCSYPAAASRYATLSALPCAFVTMECGTVRYAARSTALRRVKAWISPRMPIPQGSVAYRLRTDGQSQIDTDIVAQDIWFQEWESGLDLNEICRHYQSSDTTTSLLWFEEEILPKYEFDRFGRRVEEDEDLAELTGDLPWPGKRRRR